MPEVDLKEAVADFWDSASCGEAYMQGSDVRARFTAQASERYRLEPYIFEFAKFAEATGRNVLEIGVGLGADHVEWAKANPRLLVGIDLTPRAVNHTNTRLSLFGYRSDLQVGDAENLPFKDNSLDIVYSWGVLHHSPNPTAAVAEIFRVLRPGGIVRAMIYHKSSITGYMLWMRYGLLKGRPATRLDEIYFHYLESPGTKAYSMSDARRLFAGFSTFNVTPQLGCGDLLDGVAGQRHKGAFLSFARAIWPRWFIRHACSNHGLFLLIEARK